MAENWNDYGNYAEEEIYRNKSFWGKVFSFRTLKNVLKWFFYLLIIALFGVIAFRMSTSKPGKSLTSLICTPELKAAQEKAQRTQLPEDAQAARDLADLCDRFEKKLYDLELTRNVSIQMGPQIRLIQSNDTMMAEKIQTTIMNTIPLWKNQMVLALGIAHSQEAMKAERAVTDATNELLKKNAATLKQGTIDIAKESERGIVDIETLQQTNKQLIETLDELNKIRADGKVKRANAEQELGRIEGELRAKLMEINQ